MMNRKPKSFYMVYESGIRAERVDPVTGKPWYRLAWKTIKRSMAELARTTAEPLSIISLTTDEVLTVSPEGRWS